MAPTRVAELLAHVQVLESELKKRSKTIDKLNDDVVELLGLLHSSRKEKEKVSKELSRQRIKAVKATERIRIARHLGYEV